MCRGACGSLISRTQKYVTIYDGVALADITKKGVIETDLAFHVADVGKLCIAVFEDNQGAVQVSQNPSINSNLCTLTCGTTFSWSW